MSKLKADHLIEQADYRHQSNQRLQQILERMQMTDDPKERKRLEDTAVAEFYSDAKNPAPKLAPGSLSASGSKSRATKNSGERSHRSKQLAAR